MPLASDDIVIDVSPAISLRPSLRAAYRLERKYDGFDKLLSLVSRGNLLAISDVIREGAGDNTVTRYLDSLEGMSLHIGINRLASPAAAFILALAGVDREASESTVPAKPITFEQYHINLFRIATGWMGWTPDQAWDATPAEIMEAYKGRTEMLAAIFGGSKEEDEGKATDLTQLEGAERSEAIRRFAALGDLTVTRMP